MQKMVDAANGPEPPLERGSVVDLEIGDLNHQGEGVGLWKGFTVFVPGAVPGDRIRAKIVFRQKTYARALMLSAEYSSPYRVNPPCSHYPQCGGCQLQHVDYGYQLKVKRKIVEDAMRRIGRLDVPVLPVLGMECPWRYRNKVQVPVGKQAGEIVAGFYERRTHKIVNLSDCPAQYPEGNDVIRAIRSALQELNIPVYNEKSHLGVVRHVLSRISYSTGEVMVVLVTNGRNLPAAARIVELLRDRLDNLVGIVQNINTKKGNVIMGEENITLWGRPFLAEKLDGLVFHLSPGSFFQINSQQTGMLYEQVLQCAALTGSEAVFDLYCGIGTISLYLSRWAGRVTGVEEMASAVRDARKNAALNGIKNANFVPGKVEKVVPGLLKGGCTPDVVVIDPPRKGCDAGLLEIIVSANPDRIVYVSCNPSTLARDLKFLSGYSYLPEKVLPVDMFPQTSHVECVALMSRVEK